jgi:hypothetical protein
MTTNGQHPARKIHDSLKHPIIDADGHWAEFAPLMREEFRRIGGDTAVEALAWRARASRNSLSMSVAERRPHAGSGRRRSGSCRRRTRSIRATAMMPRLLYERLDELGLDFSVIYPTAAPRLLPLCRRTSCGAPSAALQRVHHGAVSPVRPIA